MDFRAVLEKRLRDDAADARAARGHEDAQAFRREIHSSS
jgi:hypothetical protein